MTPKDRLLLNMKAHREGWNIPKACLGNSALVKLTRDGLSLDEAERQRVTMLLGNGHHTSSAGEVCSKRELRAMAVSIAAHQRFHGLMA